jgi:hypothetical protein
LANVGFVGRAPTEVDLAERYMFDVWPGAIERIEAQLRTLG